MRFAGISFCPFLVIALLTFGDATTASAQSGVGVEIDEVVDNRMAAEMMSGWLEVHLKLTGQKLDRVTATRVLVKDARDDKGTILSGPDKIPEFHSRDTDMGRLEIRLESPPRSARSVRVSGTVELFVPARDPSSVVKIEKALTKTDKPLVSKNLRAEKIAVTVLSQKGYAARREDRKLDEKKIAEARAEGKRQGVSEKEMEAMIELVKAMEQLVNEPAPEGSVILYGKEADFDRIQAIRILGPDGKEFSGSRTSTTTGGETIMIMNPNEKPPANATLELTILTAKAKVSVPFELKSVSLP